MAQILKEEVRIRIENAAIEQLVKAGMHKTNMRDIARGAGITVGNLYRYYASKDQLIINITAPIIKGLDQIIKDQTSGSLDLEKYKPIIPPPPAGADPLDYIENLLATKLRNSLIEIGDLTIAYPRRMTILMDDSVVGKKLYTWGISVISDGFNSCFQAIDINQKQIDMTITVISMAFCEGIIQLLKGLIAERDIVMYRKMLDIFLYTQTSGITALLSEGMKRGKIKAVI